MNIHAYQRQVIAYHGCDRKTFEDVLLNGARLRPSERPWDWLGRGIYFWEHGPDRANQWAKEKVTKGDIQEAAVLGAIIHLENCFDPTFKSRSEIPLTLSDFSRQTPLGHESNRQFTRFPRSSAPLGQG